MADLPHRRHGNSPPRRAQHELHLATSPETRSDSGSTTEAAAAAAAEEHVCGTRICEKKKESNQFCNEETKPTSPRPEKRQRPPDKSVTALLKRIRIHPEAQRILGNSCIPVVSLERLNFRSVSLSCLQPVVCLVRLPSQKQTELHDDDASHHQQNGFSQTEEDVFEITDDSPESEGLSDPSPPDETTSTSWTEPYCPDSSSSEEPEQDSGFDCESNPDQPYILFDSGCDEWEADEKTETDPEMFYLDPDPEQQNMVIQVDPEPEVDQDQDLPLQVVDEPEIKCEVDVVQMVQMDDGDEQGLDLRCSVKEEDSSNQHEPVKEETVETESEDFCGVCLNGGDLLCCDRCPKVYHLTCHIPPLISFPLGDWVCSLCRSDQEPVEVYDCENTNYVKAPYTLSNQDQRRCEKLTLLLCCHLLSAPFHEPVSPLARNYYQIIKRPVDLSLIRRKLDKSNTLHYFSAEQFVDDVLLMFKNCATFNYPDSEVAQAGRNLEVFFLSKLTELFPDRTFPLASQDRTDRARLLWMNRTKKENHRKKRRHVFSGKKYYL